MAFRILGKEGTKRLLSMLDYTAEQEKLVLKVLSHKPHQYYDIIGVHKSASEGEIKKSYRKVVVKLHPDKNTHPRASEAFQIFNKAWEILSDPQKKTIFDQTGSDPTARFQGNPGNGAAASGFEEIFRNARGTQRRAEFNEDIFNMFFGGNQPGTSFMFGGNGFTFQSNGGDPFSAFRNQGRAARGAAREENSSGGLFLQILPLLIFLGVTLIATFFSGDEKNYSMKPTMKYNTMRETPKYHIPFFVEHLFAADKSPLKLKKFDRNVEATYIQDRKTLCDNEQVKRKQMMDDAQGWFSVDEVMLQRAKSMPMPNCVELQHYGII